MYPVMLNVSGRRCLVVGGGGVALRKVDGLLDDGAVVTVVAPAPLAALEERAGRREIALERRGYREGEAAGYALVFAATDDRAVNRRVFEEAGAAGVWVNVADDPELCTFHLPARLRRGALQLAVASAGEAPFVVRRMRRLLESRFGPEWEAWVDAAASFRAAVREAPLTDQEREKRYTAFFDTTVDAELLRARLPSAEELAGWLAPTGERAGDTPPPPAEAGQAAPSSPASSPSPIALGFVSLVGAGPGDAGLLSVRGRRRLLAADTVVYDRLAATALPAELPAHVTLHSVGKCADHHPVPQDEINAMLVRLGREGKRVVRLKGGDPYVFGRGGEEAEALAAAGVPFEVVPSVTAAIAVPAYAGIPVTHRNRTVRVTLVTAHEAAKAGGPQVRWDLLGGDAHATLLGYMGVTSLPQVVHELLEAGLAGDTPAAMIERGTTPSQRVVRSTLAGLPEAVTKAGVRPPALFVIGPTVDMADQLDWFGRLPLCRERLVAVGSERDPLTEALSRHGAEVIRVPLPVTPAARIVMGALPLSGCVLRSADEADVLDDERDGAGWGSSTMTWCLSPEAARRARELGWSNVEEVAAGGDQAAALVAAITGASGSGGPGRPPGR